jgi:hypothetical protein
MLFSRNFFRLPPLLRVASIVGLLFPFTAIALLVAALVAAWRSFPQLPADFYRVLVIAVSLSTLGGAVSAVVNSYSLRFRQPARASFPLKSWQSQVGAIALLAMLPLCALVLAFFIAPSSYAFWLVLLISLIGAVIVGVGIARASS